MFVRTKDMDGSNVTLVAHKISSMHEATFEKEPDTNAAPTNAADGSEAAAPVTRKGTIVTMDNGVRVPVADTERALRSKILKANTPDTEDSE